MRSLCDADDNLVVGQTFRLKTLFVLLRLTVHFAGNVLGLRV